MQPTISSLVFLSLALCLLSPFNLLGQLLQLAATVVGAPEVGRDRTVVVELDESCAVDQVKSTYL